MRLDLDCIRHILLCVEENTGLRKYCPFIDSGLEESQIIIGNEPVPLPDYQVKLLKKYDNDKLIYHINFCIQSELLFAEEPLGQYQIIILDLTPKGHNFLEDIRDNNVWSSIKGVAAKVGSKSLDTAMQITASVITQLIRTQLGI